MSRLSFSDVIKRLTEFSKGHPAYISSNPAAVDRYVVVHGQIILQQFSEYPDDTIRKSAFVTGLNDKMEERHHTKWLVKQKLVLKKEMNLNPRAAMGPVVSSRKAMPATTTRLINRIWGEFYSHYSPDDTEDGNNCEVKEEEELEEEQEDNGEEDSEEVAEEEKIMVVETTVKPQLESKLAKRCCSNKEIKWDGEPIGKTSMGQALYRRAIVHGDVVAAGGSVLVETDDIYFVEFMYEKSNADKMAHGRLMLRGNQTVLGNTANDREVFLTNDCLEFKLEDITETVVVEVRSIPWGYQNRKANAKNDKIDRANAEERKSKGLPVEYYFKSLYWPEKGAFFCLPTGTLGLGSGVCHSCKMKETQRTKETFKLDLSMNSFVYKGVEYKVEDFAYLGPYHFAAADVRDNETFKSSRNVGLKPYVVCQLTEIILPKTPKQAEPESTKVKVRRFFRPEDISAEKAYSSDIREVRYL